MTPPNVPRRWLACAYAALLLGINVYVAHRLFILEYGANLESNEGSFIAISRFIAAHPFDLLWWPLWDVGIPFQNTYLPLLHVLVALFSTVTGCSPALSYHAVCAFFYCLGPVTLFLLAAVMSERPGTSFLAALLYSLLSPSAFLVPAIKDDIQGVWNARRLHVLGYYGEGPHVTMLALLPLAGLFLYLSLKRHHPKYCLITGVLMAAVVLTNAFGAVDLLLISLCLLCTVNLPAFKQNFLTALLIAVGCYLFISPSLPPSLMNTIRINSANIGGDYSFSLRSFAGLIIMCAGGGILWAVTRKWKVPVHLRFFLLFAFLISSIPLLALYFSIFVVPQPHRYQVEMEMGLCLLLVFAAQWLLDRAPRAARTAVVLAVLLLSYRQTIHYVRFARRLIQPVDITKTVEYKMARWTEEHFRGQRVMISGSISFWFNVFTETPQLHGGHDPNAPNWTQRQALFAIFSGMNTGSRDVEISLLWLKAFGAQAISVPGPGSREYYKPFWNPRKFERALPVLWREGDDVIYAVPNRTSSLAHVIPAGAVVSRTPINGLDVDQVASYVAALDDPAYPVANVKWHDFHSLSIDASVQPGRVVSVQVTHHPGWHARVSGVPQELSRDGLGLIVVRPECHGPCRIELSYDGGLELMVTRTLSALVVLGAVAWCGLGARRRCSEAG